MMKIQIFGVIAMVFVLAACSSSSSGGGGNGGGGNAGQNVNFEKQAVGQWLSECRNSQEDGNYRELVNLESAGKGYSQLMTFQTADCSGVGNISGNKLPFTYSVKSTDGVSSKLEVTPQGENAYEISLVIDHNKMTITWPAQQGGQPTQSTYDRISAPNEEKPVPSTNPQAPQTNDAQQFDLFAKGRWVSKICSNHQNGQSSYQLNAIFYGQGMGEFEILSYANTNCTGGSQRSTQRFQYQVDHFANKAGQITLNGEIMDVMFDVAQMTVLTENGNTVYQKAD